MIPDVEMTSDVPERKSHAVELLFRDSYGSSLAPLFTEAYSKITIIDVRYIATPMLKSFVEFTEGSDALFIYGVDVLNNSSILKVF